MFMKIARFIISLLIPVVALGFYPSTVSAADTGEIPCITGYSVKSVSDVDPRDAEAALKVWSSDLAGQFGFKLTISLYDNVDKLVADFMSKKLDFMVITSVDYLRMAKILKAKPDVAQYRSGKPTLKYLVLAATDIQKASLEPLRNKKVSILKANPMAQMFLDTFLMQSKLPSSERFFAAVDEKSKESQAILDVFFGKSAACVVTDTAFQTMTELNPQVGRKLQILSESPDLIGIVGFFRPDYPPDHKKKAIQGMSSDYKKHERSKQITLLFNVEKMDIITDSQLDSVRKLVSDYDRLKKMK
jgi:phosphonate transport system substrate-binding protein